MLQLDLNSIILALCFLYVLFYIDFYFFRPTYYQQNLSESDPSNTMASNNNRKERRRLSESFVKTMTLKTCVGIYDELKKMKPEFYRNAPSDGLKLTIHYADTMINDDEKFDKTIVAIHGLAGNYSHFNKLLEFYRNTNVRVVAPNLPDFSHTRKTKVYWHSSVEKSTFVKDFLAKLNIKTIDCLVSHSYGVHTIAAIWDEPGDIQIKSVFLIAPQPFPAAKDFDRIKKVFRFKNDLWYNFLSLCRVHKYPSPIRFSNINELLECCTIVVEEDIASITLKRMDLLTKLNIPVVLLYGDLERLISKSTIAKVNEKLLIKPEEIIILDPKDESSYENLNLKQFNSFVIKDGGHFAHCNHHEIANKIVENLIHYQHQL